MTSLSSTSLCFEIKGTQCVAIAGELYQKLMCLYKQPDTLEETKLPLLISSSKDIDKYLKSYTLLHFEIEGYLVSNAFDNVCPVKHAFVVLNSGKVSYVLQAWQNITQCDINIMSLSRLNELLKIICFNKDINKVYNSFNEISDNILQNELKIECFLQFYDKIFSDIENILEENGFITTKSTTNKNKINTVLSNWEYPQWIKYIEELEYTITTIAIQNLDESLQGFITSFIEIWAPWQFYKYHLFLENRLTYSDINLLIKDRQTFLRNFQLFILKYEGNILSFLHNLANENIITEKQLKQLSIQIPIVKGINIKSLKIIETAPLSELIEEKIKQYHSTRFY